MTDTLMLKKEKRLFQTGYIKVFAIMYSIVALPMIFYGMAYVDLIRANQNIFMPLNWLNLSFLICLTVIVVQNGIMRDVKLVLSGEVLDENRLRRAKARALNYPFYLMVITAIGWTISLNIITYIPVYILSQSNTSDLIIANILGFSGALTSILISYFICERAVSGFLSLPEINKLEPSGWIFKPTLTLKIVTVCLVIIISLGLNFAASIMISSVYELSTRDLAINAIVAIFSGIVSALLVSTLFARSIRTPIMGLINALRDISEGEGDLTKQLMVTSKDEIGDLAHYFNKTFSNIKTLVKSIKSEANNLSAIGTDLAGNMTETSASVNEIAATTQGMRDKAIYQSASVTETNTTMEAITKNINKLNSLVENQSISVAQSSSSIEEMLASIQSVNETLIKNDTKVRDLEEASEIGRSGLAEVAADIHEVARESEGLLEINAVMQNIASQTNLLSMNAAIEAAHAGESGKGFAVVADEIRKLAESSGKQSKTISSVLKKMKNSINKITGSTENVLQKFEAIDTGIKTVAQQEENIRRAMEEQAQGSKQIIDAIGYLNDTTGEVKSGTNKMLEDAKEVILKSEKLKNVTQEISGGMNEMALGAREINSALSNVNQLSQKNRDSIGLLIKGVSRFRVE